MSPAGWLDGALHRLDRLAELFGPRLLVGLSGGSDSVALTCLAMQWQARRGSSASIDLCIIDHGLRPGSAEEACGVAEHWRGRGARVQVLRATSLTPGPGLQERARTARHQLLAQAARDVGARLVLLGHTLDDQMETVAMRLARRTGLEGLAGMRSLAPSPAWRSAPEVAVARPLLDERRADLRSWLTGQGERWIDDPSNKEDRFERVRVRWHLARLETAGADVTGLARLSRHAGQLRAELDRQVMASLSGLPDSPPLQIPAGNSSLDLRLLALACAAVGGAARVPDNTQTSSLAAALCDGRPATLAGALVRQRGVHWQITPAPPRRSQPPPIQCAVSIPQQMAALAGIVPKAIRSPDV